MNVEETSDAATSDAIHHLKVLDKGYVELIDYMGDENAPIDAARVSFGRRASEFSEEKNDGLRRYLKAHNHTTPFEMVTFKFRVRAPVLVWWHWVRHRIASYNFQSGRYVPFNETDAHVVNSTTWRMQSEDNKQGSSGEFIGFDAGFEFTNRMRSLQEQCFALYQDILDSGGAKEQARFVLPFGAVYYDAIVQMNARSLGNFLHLRRAPDAQTEIRAYADALHQIVSKTHPKMFAEAASE